MLEDGLDEAIHHSRNKSGKLSTPVFGQWLRTLRLRLLPSFRRSSSLPGGDHFRMFAHIVIESGRFQIVERKPAVAVGLADANKFWLLFPAARSYLGETLIAKDGDRAVLR
jgi:hypothetical protein